MVLQYMGLEDSIVGFHTHIVDSYECITACSRSGQIKTWKLESAFKLLEKVGKFYFLNSISLTSFLSEYFQRCQNTELSYFSFKKQFI